MLARRSLLLGCAFASVAAVAALPTTMRAVQASGTPCTGPDWACLSLKTDVPVPSPGLGEVLLEMQGSSVNPVNIDLVEPSCKSFFCSKGTIGNDAAGKVVAIGPNPFGSCKHLSVGDNVWTSVDGAYAEYAVASCKSTGKIPSTLSPLDAATIPVVGVTSLECLQATYATTPWKGNDNLTVAITSGQGGTGFIAIQLAKALGAKRVVTAATGPGIGLVESLGADLVIDFMKEELFGALPDNSVDVVFDNFGANGTADRAMHAIRPGGTFLVLEGGNGGQVSKHPKAGVHQIFFGLAKLGNFSKLDELARLFDEHELKPHTQQAFGLSGVPDAFNTDKSGHVLGKLAVDPTK